MDKKGVTKEAIEAARIRIEDKICQDMESQRRVTKYAFISIMIMIFVSGLWLYIFTMTDHTQSIPDGCSVVDNISACHMEERTYFLPLGKIFMFYPESTRICEKKLVCYDGRVSEWP